MQCALMRTHLIGFSIAKEVAGHQKPEKPRYSAAKYVVLGLLSSKMLAGMGIRKSNLDTERGGKKTKDRKLK